jgi:hypothetical protein
MSQAESAAKRMALTRSPLVMGKRWARSEAWLWLRADETSDGLRRAVTGSLEVVEQEIEDGGGHCFDFNVWGRRVWRKSRITFLLQG